MGQRSLKATDVGGDTEFVRATSKIKFEAEYKLRDITLIGISSQRYLTELHPGEDVRVGQSFYRPAISLQYSSTILLQRLRFGECVRY